MSRNSKIKGSIDSRVLPEVAVVLATRVTVEPGPAEGAVVKIDGQLERRIYTRVNEVLAALGLKWNRHAGGHTANASVQSIRDLLESVVLSGTYVNPKHNDLYETPVAVARELATMARDALEPAPESPPRPLTLLEPSAGNGRLIDAARHVFGARIGNVAAVERLPACVKTLQARGDCFVHEGDFLDPNLPTPATQFDIILMNPPFTRGADAEHVRRAHAHFLAPHGVLAAIVSRGCARFNNSAAAYYVGERAISIHDLPSGTFASEGTQVETSIVILRR